MNVNSKKILEQKALREMNQDEWKRFVRKPVEVPEYHFKPNVNQKQSPKQSTEQISKRLFNDAQRRQSEK